MLFSAAEEMGLFSAAEVMVLFSAARVAKSFSLARVPELIHHQYVGSLACVSHLETC